MAGDEFGEQLNFPDNRSKQENGAAVAGVLEARSRPSTLINPPLNQEDLS